MNEKLLKQINKALATKYSWKLMRILFDRYGVDRKEIINIIYDKALRSKWLGKFRGETDKEFSSFIRTCVVTHLRNLLRSESRRSKKANCSYDNLHNKAMRGEIFSSYIYTESVEEEEEPKIVSAPSDYNAVAYIPDYETMLTIQQIMSKHLDDKECYMIEAGYSIEQIAVDLDKSVSNLRLRLSKVRKQLQENDLDTF